MRTITNKPFWYFVSTLEAIIEYKHNKAFINTIKYDGNIDISIDGDVIGSFDVSRLYKKLKKYDLDLVEKVMLLEVLVLTDK